MLLPAVTQYSLDGAKERYAEVAVAMGLADSSDGAGKACAKLVDGLKRLTSDLSVPSLAEFGVEKDDFVSSAPLMAQQALASGSPAFNPVVPSQEDVVELYSKVHASA